MIRQQLVSWSLLSLLLVLAGCGDVSPPAEVTPKRENDRVELIALGQLEDDEADPPYTIHVSFRWHLNGVTNCFWEKWPSQLNKPDITTDDGSAYTLNLNGNLGSSFTIELTCRGVLGSISDSLVFNITPPKRIFTVEPIILGSRYEISYNQQDAVDCIADAKNLNGQKYELAGWNNKYFDNNQKEIDNSKLTIDVGEGEDTKRITNGKREIVFPRSLDVSIKCKYQETDDYETITRRVCVDDDGCAINPSSKAAFANFNSVGPTRISIDSAYVSLSEDQKVGIYLGRLNEDELSSHRPTFLTSVQQTFNACGYFIDAPTSTNEEVATIVLPQSDGSNKIIYQGLIYAGLAIAAPRILQVGADEKYYTISEAIFAAHNHDVIEIAQGSYIEQSLNTGNKSLTIRGLGEVALISAVSEPGSALISSSAASLRLENIRLAGDGTQYSTLALRSSADKTALCRVAIQRFSRSMLITGQQVTITQSSIADNQADSIEPSAMLSANRISFHGNRFENNGGYAGMELDGMDVSVRYNLFRNRSTVDAGKLLTLNAASAEIVGNSFDVAELKRGETLLSIVKDSSVDIVNNTFVSRTPMASSLIQGAHGSMINNVVFGGLLDEVADKSNRVVDEAEFVGLEFDDYRLSETAHSRDVAVNIKPILYPVFEYDLEAGPGLKLRAVDSRLDNGAFEYQPR